MILVVKKDDGVYVVDTSKAYYTIVTKTNISFVFYQNYVIVDANIDDPESVAKLLADYMKSDVVTDLDTFLKLRRDEK